MSDKTRVLVTGAGGFIGNHLVDYLKAHGYWVRGVDIKMPEYSDTPGGRVRAARPAPLGCVPAGDPRRRPRLRARGRHGRHGVHLALPRHDPAEQRPDRPAHDRGGSGERRVALPLHIVRVHLSREPADRGQRRPRSRRTTRIPPSLRTGTAGRRSWARRSASTSPMSSRWTPGPSASTTSTARTARSTVGARRRLLPCAERWRSPRTEARSRSGATASRRVRSATSTTASRASTGSCTRSTGPLNLGTDHMVTINELAQIGHGRRPASRSRSSTSTDPRVCGAGTPTTPDCARCSVGNPASSSRTGSRNLPMDREAGGRALARRRSSPTTTMIPRFDVLGVQVSAIDIPTATDEIGRWIEQRERQYVCVDRGARRHGVAVRRRAPGHPQPVGSHHARRHADGVGRQVGRPPHRRASTAPT